MKTRTFCCGAMLPLATCDLPGHTGRGIRAVFSRLQPVIGWPLNFCLVLLTASTLIAQSTPSAVSVTPNSGSGASQTFTFVWSDGAGYADMNNLAVIFDTSITSVGACYFGVDPVGRSIWFTGDNGAYIGSVAIGSSGTVQNSQCIVNASGSTLSGSGNNLTLTVTLTFKPAFAGAKSIYMYAQNYAGLNSWQTKGSWTVPAASNQPPQAVSVTPASGSGASQTFTFVWSDGNGYADMNNLAVIFDTSITSVGACYFGVDPVGRSIWFTGDNGAYIGSVAIGSSGTVQNSQCIVNASGSTLSGSGNNLTLTVTLTFKPAFAGAKSIYMYAQNYAGLNSWQTMGTWTVSSAAVPVMPPMTGSATGAAPAAIDPTQLCAPNFGKVCTTFYSYITTTSPPTQIPLGMYGTSGTYTTGDSDVRSQFTNYTSNLIEDRNGQNLGLWCSDQQGHPVDAISIAETPAEARVPCANLNFAVSASNALYTLFGRHRAQAQFYDRAGVLQTYDSGIVTDYYSLGMVPAGRSSDFGPLQMGPLGDFRTAVGPTIAPNSDGVTVSYTGRTVGTISVHINVPYTALKGRHQLGFPANDNYGQPNPFELFAIIVYDATPAITSVNPSSVAAQTPTTLTITGSGFGDHPTAFIAGSAYNLGVPSRNAQGQDVVSVSVNLPASLANSSAAVYLQSNGAGGQAFFQPQGTQNGTPRSNTVQVQVQPAPAPSILGISPTSFQIGASGIPFVISGHNLGSGVPSLDFGSSGITYIITNSSDLQVSGTLSVPTTAMAGTVTVTLTPNGRTQTATTSITLTPAPPTISGNPGIWWLGPNFVPIAAEGYYDSTVLTMTPGAGATPPTSDAPASWIVTPSAALSYLTITCMDGPCSQVTLQLTGPPVGCAQVNLQVSLNLVPSALFAVYIDQPLSVTLMNTTDRGFSTGSSTGYLSEDILQLRSSCGQVMINISLHEEFNGPFGACGGSVNWADIGPNTGLGTWTTSAVLSPDLPAFGEFSDTQGFACAPGMCTPNSNIPGSLRVPPVPLSTQANAWKTQDFYIGSKDPGHGTKTVPALDVYYTDHGRHELWNWTCPTP